MVLHVHINHERWLLIKRWRRSPCDSIFLLLLLLSRCLWRQIAMTIRARTRSSGNEVLVVPVSRRAMTHWIRHLIRRHR